MTVVVFSPRRICTSVGIAAFLVSSLAATGVSFGWGHDLSPNAQGDVAFLAETMQSDFLGRWAWMDEENANNADDPKRAPAYLDIVGCGRDLCAIEVLKTGACGGMILRLHDRGADHGISFGPEGPDRYAGRLAWTGKYSEYAVDADVDRSEHVRPKATGLKRLSMNGYPTDPRARWERTYPFELNFAYFGKATCAVSSS